jgi:tRNA A22 N-methylase
LAEKDNPEFRLVTDNIEEIYKKVQSKHPELLQPNLNKITLRPWGAREFAIMDEQIGIIIQQW